MKLKFNFISFKIGTKWLQWHLLLFSGLILFFSCQSKVSSDIPPEMIENKSIPIMDATNIETTFNDSGIVRYHLTAKRLLIFPQERNPKRDEYHEFPEGFHLQKYDQNKTIESELSGNYGKLNMKEGKWFASGNVVMVNIKGDTLRTEELNYHEKEDLIFSDKFVSIKRGDQDNIWGTGGFKSDAQMTKWEFIKTQGHVYMEDQ